MIVRRLLAQTCARSALTIPRRALATTPPVKPPPPFPTTPTCPAPTCACAPTPELPEGLEIDRAAPLNGAISSYAQHVLVCTGKDDWPSRIEEDNAGDNLAADLRELVGPRGKFSDPFHHTSILNASFPSSPPPKRRPELQTSSVYLLPQFKYVPFLPRVSFESAEALVRGYLQPDRLHPMHDGLSPIHRDRLLRKPAYRGLLWGVKDVKEVVVLVCGHGGRDRRCGVFGPMLRDEFEKRLPGMGVEVLRGPVEVEGEEGEAVEGTASGREYAARVGLISHIGGHKFAGNVIIYLPPGLKTQDGGEHPLAGHGIWYGRVEPRHVEGIVGETVLRGRVIEELFRGGIKQDGEILRFTRGKLKLRWLFIALLLCAAPPLLIMAYEDDRPLNPDTFAPFTVTDRLPVSPTAFVLTLEPATVRKRLSWYGGSMPPDESVGHAWDHGLWVLEVKQPEMQVAREYTPLPPTSIGDGRGSRLYVRKVDGGNVSGYLSKLGVGSPIQLRGPRTSFDLRGRLGLGRDGKVVFLAGGTGIAPALQAAKRLLDGDEGIELEVVWANRKRVDTFALGMPEHEGVVELLEGYKAKYPDRFSYSCTHLITSDDRDPPATSLTVRKPCECYDAHGSPVRGGKNLLMVSGPEGFVARYAGVKVWGGGKEMQGPVGGVLGELEKKYPRLGEEWLVLKL
ncbi:Sucrase/ferredoxin-like-domain-containing protein [Staphylotrichum tortipilum]|uniref:Altered inheritance of mitochondria protein 32 n=1 Tax=Staphylotrichum tortipilum TaxID=2831512 RepID=A0AAN6RTF6_9PEZI|nr:Sucrase/ferredoxin-like-domain-containing protein [Staphylotrichum longicolle]